MVKMVNLGSSFAAGPGIKPQINTAAARSGANYAHLLADRLNADLVDLSVSGATLLNIINTPQVANGNTFPPQIEGVPRDADIILVLGGGNDMAYIGGLFLEHTWLMGAVGLIGRIKGSPALAQPEAADEDEVIKRFGETLDALHAKAPNARVIVVEYLTLLGDDVKAGVNVPFDVERLEYHRAKATQLQRATRAVVDKRPDWCELVKTSDMSKSHGIGSTEPWVYSNTAFEMVTGRTWYHPNAEGHRAVAQALYERINGKSRL